MMGGSFLHDPFQVHKLSAPPPGLPPGEYYVVEIQPDLVPEELSPITFYRTRLGGEVASWNGKRLVPGADDELFKAVKDAIDAYDAAHPEEVG